MVWFCFHITRIRSTRSSINVAVTAHVRSLMVTRCDYYKQHTENNMTNKKSNISISSTVRCGQFAVNCWLHKENGTGTKTEAETGIQKRKRSESRNERNKTRPLILEKIAVYIDKPSSLNEKLKRATFSPQKLFTSMRAISSECYGF